MSGSGFYIDVYTAAGVKENGTAIDVSDVKQVEKVNRMGEITFTVPALVAAQAGMVFGKRYKVHHATLGLIGTFYHRVATQDASKHTTTITCDDSLKPLWDRSVHFNLRYGTGWTGKTAIQNVITKFNTATGLAWSVVFEAGFPNDPIAIEGQGESYLKFLDRIRSLMRGFWRRKSDTQIEFGQFRNVGMTPTYYNSGPYGNTIYDERRYDFSPGEFDASEVAGTVLNVPVLSSATENRSEYALVTSLTKISDGAAVVNRVIPVGSGQDQTQLTLERCTLSAPYAIQTGPNPDGTTYYYLRDAASEGLYGVVERTLPFDISPITNSDADLVQAANAVYISGAAYLRKFSYAGEVYSLTCVNLPATALPGDLIVLDYRGVVKTSSGAQAEMSIANQPFFIVEKETSFGEAGKPVYKLRISTNGEDSADVDAILTQMVAELDRFKVRPDPTQSYWTVPAPTLPVDPQRAVQFPFTIKRNVLYINEAKLKFRLMPFRAFSTVVGANPADTSGPSSLTTSRDGGQVTSGPSSRSTAEDGGEVTSGASSTTTSGGGGGGNPASGSQSATHTHYAFGDTESNTHYHTISMGDHTHGMAHTHVGGSHDHGMDHTHVGAAHGHGMDHDHTVPAHTHPTRFGVFTDPLTPQNVTIWLDGYQLINLRNDQTGQLLGNSVSGEGSFEVDLLYHATAQPRGLSQKRNVAGNHRIEIRCGADQGQVYAYIDGRVTIQPIQVI